MRVALAGAALAAALPAQTLPRVTKLVASAEALGVRTGVWVQVLGRPKPCYRHRSTEAFVPASNMKLLTGVLVLETLGRQYEFVTEFRLHETDRRAVLRVVSGGDPCLSRRCGKQDYFAPVARALAARGVTKLAGFVLDGTGWSGPARPPDWPSGQLQYYYAAPTGPFVLEEGCFDVTLDPGKRRAGPCPVRLAPAGVKVAVKGAVTITTSRKAGGRPMVWLARDGVRLGGKVWSGARDATFTFASPDPGGQFAQVLGAALRKGGIDAGRQLAVRPRGGGTLVYTLRSPVAVSLKRLLRDSSNFHAEQLLRVIALRANGAATLEGGRSLLESHWGKLRWAKGLVVRDGSGLSRGNRVSPRLLAAVVSRALASPYADDLRRALPVGGVSGSLRRRFHKTGGAVRAKTGWIRGASALTGLVRTKNDTTVVFSILMNYAAKRSGLNKRLKQIQDRIVVRLMEVL